MLSGLGRESEGISWLPVEWLVMLIMILVAIACGRGGGCERLVVGGTRPAKDGLVGDIAFVWTERLVHEGRGEVDWLGLVCFL
jgi:hypothetical protein